MPGRELEFVLEQARGVCTISNVGSAVLTSLSVLRIGKISTESSQAHHEL